jgi:hypothetical protein
MAVPLPPGIIPAGILHEAGFSRSVILVRLQDTVIMHAMGQPRAFTEAEAVAADEAVAFSPAGTVLSSL